MHRVELKARLESAGLSFEEVPNAPCGVESTKCPLRGGGGHLVPNAPCGVESLLRDLGRVLWELFLMHRVELKANSHAKSSLPRGLVPNAPCGVERSAGATTRKLF